MARMIAEVYEARGGDSFAGQSGLEARLGHFDDRFDRLETRFERLEDRVRKLETDMSVLKWMAGFMLAIEIAILFLLWQIMLRLPG